MEKELNAPYTLPEFARLWQKSEATIYRRIKAGLLPFFRYDGRELRIKRNDAHEIIKKGTYNETH